MTSAKIDKQFAIVIRVRTALADATKGRIHIELEITSLESHERADSRQPASRWW